MCKSLPRRTSSTDVEVWNTSALLSSPAMLLQRWTCLVPREHGFYATWHNVQSLRCCVLQGGCATLSEFLEEEALLACLANPRKPLKPRETLRRDVKSPARTKKGWPAHTPAPLRHPLSLRNAGHVSRQPTFLQRGALFRAASPVACKDVKFSLLAFWRKQNILALVLNSLDLLATFGTFIAGSAACLQCFPNRLR